MPTAFVPELPVARLIALADAPSGNGSSADAGKPAGPFAAKSRLFVLEL